MISAEAPQGATVDDKANADAPTSTAPEVAQAAHVVSVDITHLVRAALAQSQD